jgi:hypothetical protein
MKWLQQIWQFLTRWRYREKEIWKPLWVEDLPEKPQPKKVYIAGENEHLWYAAMQCPCGCQEILYMSLMPDGHPKWTLTKQANGTISLHPSVWRQVGCRSHFFLRSGKIQWCQD